ncbi:hypothetical protein [Pseudomonas piscis]|uniref:Uncharacterized protein n=1 Tax=Pseudomonas piscis TaxID=2614538 RepID=A0A7X1U6T1_9PSED|nr:hypothetical protein [Pseudomonas piscis]MQA56490.1 hypothetical protein [Pseudomonas piscis]
MPYNADQAFIQQQWLDEAYPRENTLILGNGFYCLFELPHGASRLQDKVWLPALDHRPAEACEGLATLGCSAHGPEPWQALGGECAAHGGDGFLALQEKDSQRLIWLLVLRETNPFAQVRIRDRHIEAQSTSGVSVCIPIERPDQLTLVWPAC